MEDKQPINARLQECLDAVQQSRAWLAKESGVAPSTVTRALSGARIPTIETLSLFATVLGMTLEELVTGTNVEDRLEESLRLVSRGHYDAAVAQVIEFERRAGTAERRVQTLEEELGQERQRRRTEQKRCEDLEREVKQHLAAAKNARLDRERYARALGEAVADVARLRTLVDELRDHAKASLRTAQITRALAGLAAVASVATYLRKADTDHDPDEEPETEDLDEQ